MRRIIVLASLILMGVLMCGVTSGEDLELRDWIDVPKMRNRYLWDEKNEYRWFYNDTYASHQNYAMDKEMYINDAEISRWIGENWELGCRDWLISYFCMLPSSKRFTAINGMLDNAVMKLKEQQAELFPKGGEFETYFTLKDKEWRGNPLYAMLKELCDPKSLVEEGKFKDRAQELLVLLELGLAGIERFVKFDELYPAVRFIATQHFMEMLITTEYRMEGYEDKLQMHSSLVRYLWEYKHFWMKNLAVAETERILSLYWNYMEKVGKNYVGVQIESRVADEVFKKYYKTLDFRTPTYNRIKNWWPMFREYMQSVPLKRRIRIAVERGIRPDQDGKENMLDIFSYYSNEPHASPRVYLTTKNASLHGPPRIVIVNGKEKKEIDRIEGKMHLVWVEDEFLEHHVVVFRYFQPHSIINSNPQLIILDNHVNKDTSLYLIACEINGMIYFTQYEFNRQREYLRNEMYNIVDSKLPIHWAATPEDDVLLAIQDPTALINPYKLLSQELVEKLKAGEKIELNGIVQTEKHFKVFTSLSGKTVTFTREKEGRVWTAQVE